MTLENTGENNQTVLWRFHTCSSEILRRSNLFLLSKPPLGVVEALGLGRLEERLLKPPLGVMEASGFGRLDERLSKPPLGVMEASELGRLVVA